MPNTKEIKNRIGSVQNTQKITNAMYLISSTKMRKAKEELDKTRPYFEMQENEIRRIFQTEIDIMSRYFYPKTGRKPAETYAYLVITADKGLAGASVEDVAVHAFAPREFVEFVPAMFFVQYCLLCIRLHEGFYALLF